MSKTEPSEIQKAVGKRIRAAREALKLSQEELGDRVDVSAHAISNYERAFYTPPLDRLAQIAMALGKSLRDLMPDDEDIPLSADEVLIIEMIAAARQLNTEALKVAVDQVTGLVQIGAKKAC
jgi:transcriptional regulator with XRE-family HTH domain